MRSFFLQILEAAVTLPKIFSSASIHYTSLCSSKQNSRKGKHTRGKEGHGADTCREETASAISPRLVFCSANADFASIPPSVFRAQHYLLCAFPDVTTFSNVLNKLAKREASKNAAGRTSAGRDPPGQSPRAAAARRTRRPRAGTAARSRASCRTLPRLSLGCK